MGREEKKEDVVIADSGTSCMEQIYNQLCQRKPGRVSRTIIQQL